MEEIGDTREPRRHIGAGGPSALAKKELGGRGATSCVYSGDAPSVIDAISSGTARKVRKPGPPCPPVAFQPTGCGRLSGAPSHGRAQKEKGEDVSRGAIISGTTHMVGGEPPQQGAGDRERPEVPESRAQQGQVGSEADHEGVENRRARELVRG